MTTTTLDPVKDAAARFASDTTHHQLEVLHEDGLYRHLRFTHREPLPAGGTRISGMYWFDLLTWPGRLTIDGDMGTYTFARERDMVAFFRGQRANPSYWAEKLRAGTGSSGARLLAKAYSEDKLRQLVAEHVADVADEWPGLAAAVQAEVLNDPDGALAFESEARAILDAFSFAIHSTQYVCGVEGCLHADHIRAFRFDRAWEWDLHDFTFHYLWCCHAIVWGIAQYDAARAAKGEATSGG